MAESEPPFAAALLTHRRRAGFTQERLAELAGLSVNAVSALERGERRRPYPNTVRALSAALGLSDEERNALVAAARGGRPGVPVPRQLPPAVAQLTGRDADLDRLDELVPRLDGDRPATVVAAIVGTAGVGKTSLAVTWAHRVAGRFPDGQLYVNLRGYDAGPPMSAAEALDGFLRAFDVPGDKIPAGVEQRAALFRSVVAGRRILVLLDNAGGAEQVRPLLPGSSSLVVVTSRATLTGLAVSTGAVRVHLGRLPPADAVLLLRGVIGARRADAEPGAVRALAQRCARLPLALQLGGQQAAARPHQPLSELVAELADESERLEVLSRGVDVATAVRAVFSWSYRHLTAAQARVFRLVGLHPGYDVSAEAVAAGSGLALAAARRLLHELVDAQLLEPAPARRFRAHDLLREYARGLVTAAEAAAALPRLVGYYLHTAAVADERLHPGRRRALVDGAPAPAEPVVLADYAAAMRWCGAELPNVVPVVDAAARSGLEAAAWQLANNLWSYFYLSGHRRPWIDAQRIGLSAAERIGDLTGQARMCNGLGSAERGTLPPSAIVGFYRRAMTLFREVGDPMGEGGTHVNLADVQSSLGRHDEALEHGRQALAIFRTLGNRYAEAAAVCTIGEAYLALHRFDEAVQRLNEVLELCRQIDHRSGQGVTLVHLGHAYSGLGDDERATRHLVEGLALCRENGDRTGAALALDHLGRVHRTAGRTAAARRCWREAATLYDRLGDERGASVRARLADLSAGDRPDSA